MYPREVFRAGRRVVLVGLAGLGAGSLAGCAAVWGFDDYVGEAPEASVDGAAPAVDGAAVVLPVEDAGTGTPCTGVCVAPPPPFWQGPFAMSESTGDVSAVPGACGGNYPNEAYLGKALPDAPGASCSCACGPPTAVACGSTAVAAFNASPCGASCATGAASSTCGTMSTAGCHPPKSNTLALLATASAPSSAGCTPQRVSNVPPVQWQSHVRLCAPALGSPVEACADARVCAPPAAPGFSHCISRLGTFTCPSDYPVQKTYYGGETDNRGCSACTCGAPTGLTCLVTAYPGSPNGNSCGGPGIPLAPLACTPIPAAASVDFVVSPGDAGACAPATVLPSGAFEATSPTTLCCEG